MKVVNRIKKSGDFSTAIKKGNSYHSPSFVIHVRKTDNKIVRVGISASTKLGCAVVRNRIKRQVRAMCDELIDYQKQSLDVVIIVRYKFLEKTFDDNKSLLSDILKVQVGL